MELDGRLLDDPMSCGGTSFLIKSIPTKLVVPDSIENNPDYNQKLEIVRLALRVGAVALHCTGLPLDELRLENLPLSIFPRIKWISSFLVSMVMWILAASGGNIRKLPRI